MKEIIQVTKKNWKELLVFLFLVLVGIIISYCLVIFYLANFRAKLNYLSDCTGLVSSIVNYKQKDKTFSFTSAAGNIYSPKSYSYDYPDNLQCVFSQVEKNSGVADFYNSSLNDFSKSTADFRKTNNLQLFVDELNSLKSADDFNFEQFKSELTKILGVEKAKYLKTKNDLLTTAFSEELKGEDVDHSNYENLQSKIPDPKFKDNLSKLEQTTSQQNSHKDNLQMLYAVMLCIGLGILIYLISTLNFFKKYKNYLIYICSGIVLEIIYFSIIFSLIIWQK